MVTIDDVISPSEVSGWDVVFAIVTLILTWIAFRVVQKATRAAVKRVSGLTENVRLLIIRVVKYLVLFMGIGVALTFLGAQLQPFVVVVVVIAVVAVLALRGVADNFGAGVVLQTRKPVAVGDEIESQGFTGTVTELNGRSVVITTSDGQTIHLPNAGMLREPLVNNSSHGHRRSQVEVRCLPGAADPLQHWVDELVAAAGATAGVVADPAPSAVVLTVEPDRLTVLIRFWHAPLSYVGTTSAVVASLGEFLRERTVQGTVTSQRPEPPLTMPPAV